MKWRRMDKPFVRWKNSKHQQSTKQRFAVWCGWRELASWLVCCRLPRYVRSALIPENVGWKVLTSLKWTVIGRQGLARTRS